MLRPAAAVRLLLLPAAKAMPSNDARGAASVGVAAASEGVDRSSPLSDAGGGGGESGSLCQQRECRSRVQLHCDSPTCPPTPPLTHTHTYKHCQATQLPEGLRTATCPDH